MVRDLAFQNPLIVLLKLLLAAAPTLLRPTAAQLPNLNQVPESNYSAICVVGKNENLYVAEWLHYHKCLGFSHVYLYDHNSSVPLSVAAADHVAAGFVTYLPWGGLHSRFDERKQGFTSNLDRFLTTVQGRAYQHCLDTFSSRHRFIGFIDIDEFLVLYDSGVRGVNELLRQYEEYAAVSFYWILLGSSGHKQRPASGVVPSYTQCVPAKNKYNTQFKSFVNTAYSPVMYSPHRAMFRLNATQNAFAVDENFKRIAQGRHKSNTHVRASVYHYATKSEEDFMVKVKRGGGAGMTRSRGYLHMLDRRSTDNCTGAIDTLQRMCPLR